MDPIVGSHRPSLRQPQGDNSGQLSCYHAFGSASESASKTSVSPPEAGAAAHAPASGDGERHLRRFVPADRHAHTGLVPANSPCVHGASTATAYAAAPAPCPGVAHAAPAAPPRRSPAFDAARQLLLSSRAAEKLAEIVKRTASTNPERRVPLVPASRSSSVSHRSIRSATVAPVPTPVNGNAVQNKDVDVGDAVATPGQPTGEYSHPVHSLVLGKEAAPLATTQVSTLPATALAAYACRRSSPRGAGDPAMSETLPSGGLALGLGSPEAELQSPNIATQCSSFLGSNFSSPLLLPSPRASAEEGVNGSPDVTRQQGNLLSNPVRSSEADADNEASGPDRSCDVTCCRSTSDSAEAAVAGGLCGPALEGAPVLAVARQVGRRVAAEVQHWRGRRSWGDAAAARRFWQSGRKHQKEQLPDGGSFFISSHSQASGVPQAGPSCADAAAGANQKQADTAGAVAGCGGHGALCRAVSRVHDRNGPENVQDTFDLRELRKSCYCADSGLLLHSFISFSSKERSSSQRRLSGSGSARPSSAAPELSAFSIASAGKAACARRPAGPVAATGAPASPCCNPGTEDAPARSPASSAAVIVTGMPPQVAAAAPAPMVCEEVSAVADECPAQSLTANSNVLGPDRTAGSAEGAAVRKQGDLASESRVAGAQQLGFGSAADTPIALRVEDNPAAEDSGLLKLQQTVEYKSKRFFSRELPDTHAFLGALRSQEQSNHQLHQVHGHQSQQKKADELRRELSRPHCVAENAHRTESLSIPEEELQLRGQFLPGTALSPCEDDDEPQTMQPQQLHLWQPWQSTQRKHQGQKPAVLHDEQQGPSQDHQQHQRGDKQGPEEDRHRASSRQEEVGKCATTSSKCPYAAHAAPMREVYVSVAAYVRAKGMIATPLCGVSARCGQLIGNTSSTSNGLAAQPGEDRVAVDASGDGLLQERLKPVADSADGLQHRQVQSDQSNEARSEWHEPPMARSVLSQSEPELHHAQEVAGLEPGNQPVLRRCSDVPLNSQSLSVPSSSSGDAPAQQQHNQQQKLQQLQHGDHVPVRSRKDCEAVPLVPECEEPEEQQHLEHHAHENHDHAQRGPLISSEPMPPLKVVTKELQQPKPVEDRRAHLQPKSQGHALQPSLTEQPQGCVPNCTDTSLRPRQPAAHAMQLHTHIPQRHLPKCSSQTDEVPLPDLGSAVSSVPDIHAEGTLTLPRVAAFRGPLAVHQPQRLLQLDPDPDHSDAEGALPESTLERVSSESRTPCSRKRGTSGLRIVSSASGSQKRYRRATADQNGEERCRKEDCTDHQASALCAGTGSNARRHSVRRDVTDASPSSHSSVREPLQQRKLLRVGQHGTSWLPVDKLQDSHLQLSGPPGAPSARTLFLANSGTFDGCSLDFQVNSTRNRASQAREQTSSAQSLQQASERSYDVLSEHPDPPFDETVVEMQHRHSGGGCRHHKLQQRRSFGRTTSLCSPQPNLRPHHGHEHLEQQRQDGRWDEPPCQDCDGKPIFASCGRCPLALDPSTPVASAVSSEADPASTDCTVPPVAASEKTAAPTTFSAMAASGPGPAGGDRLQNAVSADFITRSSRRVLDWGKKLLLRVTAKVQERAEGAARDCCRWAGAAAASALLAAAGPVNPGLAKALARALPPAFCRLPDFARAELGACEVRRCATYKRISPFILRSHASVAEAEDSLRAAADADAQGTPAGADWCIIQLAAPTIICGLDILAVQEAVESISDSDRAPGGPSFFVEGLRAKPAVDGSLDLLDTESHQGWLTVLGGSEQLQPQHNYFSVDTSGLALTHLRLGVRTTSSFGGGCLRTVVLRFRVFGEAQLTQWPPKPHKPLRVENMSSVLHGAAVLSGPTYRIKQHTLQDMLLGTPAHRLQQSGMQVDDALTSPSSTNSSSSACCKSVVCSSAGTWTADAARSTTYVLRLSSQCCLKKAHFLLRYRGTLRGSDAWAGVVELQALRRPPEATKMSLLEEMQSFRELETFSWRTLGRLDVAVGKDATCADVVWEAGEFDEVGATASLVTHIRLICTPNIDIRAASFWGLPMLQTEGEYEC